MVLRLPIGLDDFRALRELGLEYVDKSHLIKEILDRPGVPVLLLPRPRRFGKTLNLSMLRCWFEKTKEDLSHLFADLSIWTAGDEYRAHFQRYPVIHFNFKGTRAATWEECWAALQLKIQDLYKEHRFLLDEGHLDDVESSRFRSVLGGSGEKALLANALGDLSAYLHRHHGEKVVILIDEYDEPLHAGFLNGYGVESLDFVRAFLGAALKSNSHLQRAVVTGILRVAKENMFSGLNNLGVYTLLAAQFNTCFGFTEEEVTALLTRTGRAGYLPAVRAWYNGYLFGGQVIYNPWSVLCYLDREEVEPAGYWLSTSSNDLVKVLLEERAFTFQTAFETLLEGGAVERELDENVALAEIHRSDDALWSLLAFSGYLKAEKRSHGMDEEATYLLSIPNREVRKVYSSTFRGWMKDRVERSGGSLHRLTTSLLAGDAESFEEELQRFVTDVLSYHDPGKLQPERVYQGFVLGLLAVLEPGFRVRSNRESGKGRPDVLIHPVRPGQPGVVLELKVAHPAKKTLEDALAEGVSQIAAGDYGAELRAAGASPVHAFAVAFDGKTVRVLRAPG
ncbi:MAG: AAA family ATPase [Polyangiaceae bacterium]|nr:AAA family ATPase [Polyangiaceae bacterium]